VEPYAVARNNHRVFIAADKFEITRLKNLARVRLIDWIKTNPELFPVVVQEIWVTIPPMETELRNAIIKEIAYHAQIFLVHDKGITIMNDIPELTIDVLKATVELLKATVDENARLKAQARKVRSGW
jgi:predicted membrane protein